ncbi:hypothetical protein PVAP13_4NG065210 [Panicum virgatum]|uniref:Uncharacterized protein n=1 Tax=Panicum virgatum TaxID=38727 RepID=A0A8T0T040_PANVG|nr:hypothetical protein PVAP13_4NG065210 [Panicum virgatum]
MLEKTKRFCPSLSLPLLPASPACFLPHHGSPPAPRGRIASSLRLPRDAGCLRMPMYLAFNTWGRAYPLWASHLNQLLGARRWRLVAAIRLGMVISVNFAMLIPSLNKSSVGLLGILHGEQLQRQRYSRDSIPMFTLLLDARVNTCNKNHKYLLPPIRSHHLI